MPHQGTCQTAVPELRLVLDEAVGILEVEYAMRKLLVSGGVRHWQILCNLRYVISHDAIGNDVVVGVVKED